MEPERVRSYLQVACAGLGFDIGEIWWTSGDDPNHNNNNNNDNNAATIVHDGNNDNDSDAPNTNEVGLVPQQQHSAGWLKFVQLYTSRSYESRRKELINPPSANVDSDDDLRPDNQSDNSAKHVLSPRLVHSIYRTAQVVWATSHSEEGLIGRSDIQLLTAVGMPVAVDGNGNMCVVVMFSPKHIPSTDDAMEYLHSISQSATSTSIPCLLPVFDETSTQQIFALRHPLHHNYRNPNNEFGEGVVARFVSLEDTHHQYENSHNSNNSSNRYNNNNNNQDEEPEVHTAHDLSAAPKDTFGIPMLPSFAELEGNCHFLPAEEPIDIFDEASYGVWNTIMETDNNNNNNNNTYNNNYNNNNNNYEEMKQPEYYECNNNNNNNNNFDLQMEKNAQCDSNNDDRSTSPTSSAHDNIIIADRPSLSECRKWRLGEFCEAFLGMSVFDIADVWVPAGSCFPDCIQHVMSVETSVTKNPVLHAFTSSSQDVLISFWNGAVGRAYSSGNPVWSANPQVFVDSGRSVAFARAKIQTVLAVPVFTGKEAMPSCVIAFYSLVRSGSVPFVLRFVQQALRLLWDGLEGVKPHKSIDTATWQQVEPADLGEMAADLEMQQTFLNKKRRHESISLFEYNNIPYQQETSKDDAQTKYLASNLQQICLPSGETITVPLHLEEAFDLNSTSNNNKDSSNNSTGANKVSSDSLEQQGNMEEEEEEQEQEEETKSNWNQNTYTNNNNNNVFTSNQTNINSSNNTFIMSNNNLMSSSLNTQPTPFSVTAKPSTTTTTQTFSLGHIATITNPEGTKRAHILGPISAAKGLPMPKPLKMPMGFPTHVIPARVHSSSSLPTPMAARSSPISMIHCSNSAPQSPTDRPRAMYQTKVASMPQLQQAQGHPPSLSRESSESSRYSQRCELSESSRYSVVKQEATPLAPRPPLQQTLFSYQTQTQSHYQPLQPSSEPYYPPIAIKQEHQQSPPQQQNYQISQQQQSQQNYSIPQPQSQQQNYQTSQQPSQNYPTSQQQTQPQLNYDNSQQQQQQNYQTSQTQQNYDNSQQPQSQSQYSTQSQQQQEEESQYNMQCEQQQQQESQYNSQQQYDAPQQQQQQYESQQDYQSEQQQQISTNGMLPSQSRFVSMDISPNPVYTGGSSSPTNTSDNFPLQYCMATNVENNVPLPACSSGVLKHCRIQGCDEPAVSRRPYCIKHSGNRLCEHNGCNKCAQGSTRFCIAHGGGRRCTFPGCDKGARDKFFCAAHGGGKRCRHNGCNKSAVGGSSLCTAHGGGRRCSVDGCDKSAQSSTKFCVKHGGGKKCAQEGCSKVARGRTLYCAAHGGGIRCKLEGCNRVAIGKLQLCRAHGGGARPKKNKGGGSSGGCGIPQMSEPQDEPGFQQQYATGMVVDFLTGL